MDRAASDMLSAVNDDGVIVGVHQNKQSQMHQLRHAHSHSSQTLRDNVDDEPRVAEHMETRIQQALSATTLPHCTYGSDVFLYPDAKTIIGKLKEISAQYDSKDGRDAALMQFMELLAEDKKQRFVQTRNLLSFILREDIFEVEPAKLAAYLDDVEKRLKTVPTHPGYFNLPVSESISFASRNQAVLQALETNTMEYQRTIDSGAMPIAYPEMLQQSAGLGSKFG
jgi:hypothetical protein